MGLVNPNPNQIYFHVFLCPDCDLVSNRAYCPECAKKLDFDKDRKRLRFS